MGIRNSTHLINIINKNETVTKIKLSFVDCFAMEYDDLFTKKLDVIYIQVDY